MKRVILTSLFIAMISATFAQKGLYIGQYMKPFIRSDHNGKIVDTEKLLENGPLIIVFYRGHWCGYDKDLLNGLNDNYKEILKNEAQLIAISSEPEENIPLLVKEIQPNFHVVYDSGYELMDKFKVHYKKSSGLSEIDALFDKNDDEEEEKVDEDEYERPVPSTFIISHGGRIVWRNVSKNMTERPNVEDILTTIKRL